MRANLSLFFLIGHAPHAELAENLIYTMPRVVAFLDEHDPPFIAKIYRPTPVEAVGEKPGRVQMWLSAVDWKPNA